MLMTNQANQGGIFVGFGNHRALTRLLWSRNRWIPSCSRCHVHPSCVTQGWGEGLCSQWRRVAVGEEEECLCKIRALTWDQVCGTDLDRIRVVLLLWLSNISKVVWVCFFVKLYFLAKKRYQMEELDIGGILVSGMSWPTWCFKYAVTVFLLPPPWMG